MDLGHLKAELDRLAGAIEHAGGRVTERDLDYLEDSAELFYERGGERAHPIGRSARRGCQVSRIWPSPRGRGLSSSATGFPR